MKTPSQTRSQPHYQSLRRQGIARASSALAVLAIPVVLASTAWLAPQALAASDSALTGHGENGLGIGGKLPRSIDLSELETRSLERFSELDSNSNGLIDAQEYTAGAKLRGGKHKRGHRGGHHRTDEADRGQRTEQKSALKAELFARLDTDNNGVLSDEEFAQARETRQALRKELHLQHRFEKMDRNGDEQLSLVEFQERLKTMRALDSDTDGTLTRAELRRGKEAHRSKRRQPQQDAERESTQG